MDKFDLNMLTKIIFRMSGQRNKFTFKPMDREAQWPTVHRIAQTRTRLKRLGTHGAHSAFNQAWKIHLPHQSWSHRTKGGSGAIRRQWVRSSCTWTWLALRPLLSGHVRAPIGSQVVRHDWSDLAHTPLKYAFAFNPIDSETQLFCKIYYLTWMTFKHRNQGVPTKIFWCH